MVHKSLFVVVEVWKCSRNARLLDLLVDLIGRGER